MAKTGWLDSVLNWLVIIGGKIAAYSVLAATFMITADVLARYILGAGTKWVVEYTGYLVVAIVFFGLAYVQRDAEHARVDFVLARLPRTIQTLVKIISLILFFAYSVILCTFGWKFFMKSFTLQTTSRTAVDVLIWPYQLVIPLGLALLSLWLIRDIVIAIKSKNRKSNESL